MGSPHHKLIAAKGLDRAGHLIWEDSILGEGGARLVVRRAARVVEMDGGSDKDWMLRFGPGGRDGQSTCTRRPAVAAETEESCTPTAAQHSENANWRF